MKCLRVMLGFLLLGAIVNILIAWALSLWSPLIRSVECEHEFQGINWGSYWSSDLEGETIPSIHDQGIGVDFTLTGADFYGCEFLQSGLPFRSLEYSWEYQEGGFRPKTPRFGTVVVSTEVLLNWGLHISLEKFDPLLGPWPIRKHVPLRPIWSGFLLNTLLYGWLLWFVVPKLVRSYRRIRGQCVECRYNLTGNISGVCPECGKQVAHPSPN